MLGLWKSKKRKSEEEKNQLKAIVTEDLLGGSEWKESKVGYLTGLSTVGKIGGSVVKNFAQSAGRLSLLFTFLTKTDNLESLPDIEQEAFDGKQRFADAARLHDRKERDYNVAMRNTRRSAYLYAAISILSVAYLVSALIMKDAIALTTLMLHLAPITLFPALTFKAAYYNWIFRNRTLDSPKVFINSWDWLPKA